MTNLCRCHNMQHQSEKKVFAFAVVEYKKCCAALNTLPPHLHKHTHIPILPPLWAQNYSTMMFPSIYRTGAPTTQIQPPGLQSEWAKNSMLHPTRHWLSSLRRWGEVDRYRDSVRRAYHRCSNIARVASFVPEVGRGGHRTRSKISWCTQTMEKNNGTIRHTTTPRRRRQWRKKGRPKGIANPTVCKIQIIYIYRYNNMRIVWYRIVVVHVHCPLSTGNYHR